MSMPPRCRHYRRRIAAVLLTALAAAPVVGLSGCASPPAYDDVPQQQASQWIGDRQLTSKGPVLTVAFVTDPPELSIERLGYQVRKGDLYLWPIRGTHKFAPVAFDLDTSRLDLKQPWRDHVYWLLEEKWDGPLERIAQPTKGQYVRRLRAIVTDAPPADDATTQPSTVASGARR
jgi:hypothetical protein